MHCCSACLFINLLLETEDVLSVILCPEISLQVVENLNYLSSLTITEEVKGSNKKKRADCAAIKNKNFSNCFYNGAFS